MTWGTKSREKMRSKTKVWWWESKKVSNMFGEEGHIHAQIASRENNLCPHKTSLSRLGIDKDCEWKRNGDSIAKGKKCGQEKAATFTRPCKRVYEKCPIIEIRDFYVKRLNDRSILSTYKKSKIKKSLLTFLKRRARAGSSLAFTHHFTLPLGPNSLLTSPVFINRHRVGLGVTSLFDFPVLH